MAFADANVHAIDENSLENKLEYTLIHNDYCAFYEDKLAEFLVSKGYDEETFSRAMDRVKDVEDSPVALL